MFAAKRFKISLSSPEESLPVQSMVHDACTIASRRVDVDQISLQNFDPRSSSGSNNSDNRWSRIAAVIINEIVSYLSTNERLIIWERICRNYYQMVMVGCIIYN
jgi:hypothetical protein